MATEISYKSKTKNKIKEPKQYNVVMHNDDFTTMEFVVSILVDIFHKDEVTAHELMMQVHKAGRAVVGSYSYDIAHTKVGIALDRARSYGYPFRMTVEEA